MTSADQNSPRRSLLRKLVLPLAVAALQAVSAGELLIQSDNVGGIFESEEIAVDSALVFDKSKLPDWIEQVIVDYGNGNRAFFAHGEGSMTLDMSGKAKFIVRIPVNRGEARTCTWTVRNTSNAICCSLVVRQNGGFVSTSRPSALSIPGERIRAQCKDYRKWPTSVYMRGNLPTGSSCTEYDPSDPVIAGCPPVLHILIANLSKNEDVLESIRVDIPQVKNGSATVKTDYAVSSMNVSSYAVKLVHLASLKPGIYEAIVTINPDRDSPSEDGSVAFAFAVPGDGGMTQNNPEDNAKDDADDKVGAGEESKALGGLDDATLDKIAELMGKSPFAGIPVDRSPGAVGAIWAEMRDLYTPNWSSFSHPDYQQRQRRSQEIGSRLMQRLVEMNVLLSDSASANQFDSVRGRHEFANEYVHLLLAIYQRFMCLNVGTDQFLNDFADENRTELTWRSRLTVVKSWLLHEKDPSVKLLKISDVDVAPPLQRMSLADLERSLGQGKRLLEKLESELKRKQSEYEGAQKRGVRRQYLLRLSRELRSLERRIMSQDRSNSAIEAQIEVLKEKKSQAECSGTENEAKASSVAPEGGGKGETLRFCPNCRWEAHEGDKFCGQCGRSLIR